MEAQKRPERLRDDLDVVLRTLRMFDPSQSPESIPPVVNRKGDRLSAYGGCTRVIMNALRVASDSHDLIPRGSLLAMASGLGARWRRYRKLGGGGTRIDAVG